MPSNEHNCLLKLTTSMPKNHTPNISPSREMMLRQEFPIRKGLDRPKIRLDMNANRICCHMHLDTSLVRNSKKSACNRTEISNAGGAVPWIERDRVLKMTMAENRHFAKSSGSASKAIPDARGCGPIKTSVRSVRAKIFVACILT